ncbi:MAG TPA: hypothetical protein VLA01_01960 [Nitrosopumilaceae archaeon]|nr:hypothetical protein [Nitrosopumilaceae archaeon]
MSKIANWYLNQKNDMKIYKPIIILGAIAVISGIIFHLQGQAIVGPESSFMYSNPEWVSYGQQIAIIGIVVSGIGIAVKIWKKD